MREVRPSEQNGLRVAEGHEQHVPHRSRPTVSACRVSAFNKSWVFSFLYQSLVSTLDLSQREYYRAPKPSPMAEMQTQ